MTCFSLSLSLSMTNCIKYNSKENHLIADGHHLTINVFCILFSLVYSPLIWSQLNAHMNVKGTEERGFFFLLAPSHISSDEHRKKYVI